MKFVFLAPRFHTNLYYQAKALLEAEQEVSLLALYEGQSEGHHGVSHEVLGYSSWFSVFNRWFNGRRGRLKNRFELRWGWPPLGMFFRLLRHERPDVLLIKNIDSVFSLLGFLYGLLWGKRVVFLVQIEKYRAKPRSWSVALAGWLGAVSITPILGDVKYPNYNSSLLYLPFVHPVVSYEKRWFQGEVINILMVGKFQKRKDQKLLLRALALLKNRYAWRLTLIGEDDDAAYTQELKDYLRAQQLENLVYIHSNIPWSEMPEWYKRSDLFVLPSYGEPAAYSILEAMSYQLPVISSDQNGTRCYIKEGANGFIFKAHDEVDLARKLDLIMTNRERLTKMGRGSYHLVVQNHSPAEFARQLVKMSDK